MATTEAAAKIADIVEAQLVECMPEPQSVSAKPAYAPDEASPVTRARNATIEQTGADPPPVE